MRLGLFLLAKIRHRSTDCIQPSLRPQKGNFMEMIPVIILVVLGVPAALAIWLIVRTVQARGRIEELSFRLSELETEIIRLKRERESARPAEPAPKPGPVLQVKTAAPSPIPPLQPAPEPKAAFTLPTREQILQRQRADLPAKPAEPPAAEPAATPVFASGHPKPLHHRRQSSRPNRQCHPHSRPSSQNPSRNRSVQPVLPSIGNSSSA